jgi:hypothetical protein
MNPSGHRHPDGLARSVAVVLLLLAGAGTSPAFVPGTNALFFDGQNDYVTFTNPPALGLTQFTLETWFRRDGPGATANTGSGGFLAVPLITKGRGEQETPAALNMNYFFGVLPDGRLAGDFEEGSGGPNPGLNHPVTGITATVTGVWYHAAATYDGTNWALFLNGAPETTTFVGRPLEPLSAQHAGLASAFDSAGTPSGYFHGVLDEVRVWNHARPAQQISNAMNLEILAAPGLVARWELNEGGGPSAFDVSGNNVTGSLSNGPVWIVAGATNAPPDPPAPLAPASNAVNLATAPLLRALVSDPDSAGLTVTFWGRATPTNSGPDFTLVALPDTQFYASSLNGGSPAIFRAQTDWIVSNRLARNIAFVTQLGDCVQNGDNGGDDAEWRAATNALYRLENPLLTLLPDGIPYGVAVGNHDQSPVGAATGASFFYNLYFGTQHFLPFPYYGGNYSTNNDNHYELFSAGGLDFVVVHLEYDTGAASTNAPVYAWANGVLQAHAARRAIVVSHHIVNSGFNATFSAQGQAMYDALKANTNLFLMLSGHVSPPEGQRTNVFDGRTVWAVMSDYQGRANGGDGWLRLYEFSPSNNVIRAQTYSPWLDQFETDADSRFDIPYAMSTPFVPLGTNAVAAGTPASFIWSGLAPDTGYEWFATVSDGVSAVAGPVWRFATAATNLALVSTGAVWRYLDNGSNQGTNWIPAAFADSGWSNGPAQLGYGDGDEATVVNGGPSGNRYITTYYRRQFAVSDPAAFTSLRATLLYDDGGVVYLNGAEAFRANMPAGAVAFDTLAASTATDNSLQTNFLSPTLLIAGTNMVAVEIHQRSATSSDSSFDFSLTGLNAPLAANVTRGPYLQLGTPTNLLIRWRTDVATDSRVRFGTNVANLNLSVTDATVTANHEVRLDGLSPSTRYFYDVGSSSSVLAGGDTNHFFLTPPPRGTPKPTRVWVIGDAGTAGRGGATDIANQTAVRDAYYNFTGTNHTDLWLQLGDNAYNSGTDAQYQAAVFDMYAALLRQSVTWPTLGNHDTAGSTAYVDTYPYFDIFTLPRNGEAGGVASGTEHYYSFDHANIHFICLDSMTANRATNGPMANWLRADLADTTNTWIIAFWHHPPYTKGSHNSDTETELIQMRTNFLPILEAGGVDLVLTGHSHSYERSFLLDGHYGPTAPVNTFVPAMKLDGGSGREDGTGAYGKPRGPVGRRGAVYAVAGSSGQISGGNLNHVAMFISLNQLGSMVLDVNGHRLDAKFLRENGATADYFTLLKTNNAPTAASAGFTLLQDATTNLTLNVADTNADILAFSAAAPPARGLLGGWNAATRRIPYTPAHGFTGADSFTFTVSDGLATSSFATVTLNVIPLADADADGIPDSWEAAMGVSNPALDPDGDGWTTLQEYQANTDPMNADAALRFPSVTRNASGHFVVTWASVGGTRYRVKFSNGDANGNYNGVFTDLVRVVEAEMDPAPVGTVSTMSFTDDFTLTGGAPPQGRRYFRVGVVK